MKNPSLFVFFLTITLLFTSLSCKSKQETQQKPPKPKIQFAPVPSGKIQAAIKLTRDSSQSFAVYLPAAYDQHKSWPALYFFDAHARGVLPVKRYKNLAERYGYVLIGSNNLKNRLSPEEIKRLADALLDESAERFNIDPQRKYIVGFSGGAKAAVFTAWRREDITGVIGCAGGFPDRAKGQTNRAFEFAGIVGKADFNYWELVALEYKLDQTSWPHVLLMHNGKHAWPPQQSVAKALDWFDFNAMRKGVIPKNAARISEFLRQEKARLSSLERHHNLLALEQEYALIVSSLEGLTDIQAFQNKLNTLTSSRAYQQARKNEMDQAEEEFRRRQFLTHALSNQDINWWKETIQKWRAIQDSSKEEFWRDQRLLSFSGLLVYLFTQQALQERKLPQAQKYVTIYQMVEPENPDLYYLQAWLQILKGDTDRAEKNLQKALSAGIDDPQKIWNNPDLKQLRQNRSR